MRAKWVLLPMVTVVAACGTQADGVAREEARPPVVETGVPGSSGEARISAGEPETLPVAELPAEAPPASDAGTAPAPSPAARGDAPGAPVPEAEAAGQQRGDANEILRRVERRYADVRSMQADFVQHLTVPLLGTTQRSEGQLFQRRPDRFMMRFSDPAGDVMVADGRHFWMYNPSVDRTQVIRVAMADGTAQVDLQQQFLSNPTQRFVATLAGSEAVGGRQTHLLSLVPRGASQYRLIRIWVDQENHLVRRFEMTEENETVRRLELNNLRLDVDLPDSLFRFTPPPGTQVFDQ